MNNIQNFKYGKDSLGLLSCTVFFLFWIFMECNEFLNNENRDEWKWNLE